MEEELYDEFGNYIGPELDSDEEQGDERAEQPSVSAGPQSSEWENDMKDSDDEAPEPSERAMEAVEEDEAGTAVVLYEDKKYYPDAHEVFGDAETRIEDEDTQPLTQPIIAPVTAKKTQLSEKTIPETTFASEFLCHLMDVPAARRNVAVIGHLGHGKTCLVDLFVQQTHPKAAPPSEDRDLKYTDNRLDEQERGISVKSTPISLVLPDSRGKSFLVNIIDTPGHPNFSDEMSCALRVADAAILVVDAVEGCMMGTTRAIAACAREELPIVLCLTKLDRLILELHLPPLDAYFKLKHTVDEINVAIQEQYAATSDPSSFLVSPARGNVLFSCGAHGYSFSLAQFAALTAPQVDSAAFGRRLWGDLYFDEKSRKFSPSPLHTQSKRSFVQFVLEPLYKMYSTVVGEDTDELRKLVDELQVQISHDQFFMDTKPLLKHIIGQFFGDQVGFVDAVSQFVPSAVDVASKKSVLSYSGSQDSDLGRSISSCDPSGPLSIHVVKQFPTSDCSDFYALGRIMSGTIKKNTTVKVLGEGFSEEDDEDMAIADVQALYIPMSRYNVEINRATAGNIVLIKGISESISKTATVTTPDVDDVAIFRPISFDTKSVVKLAVEPVNPSELPKMVEGLRRINKTYPLCVTRVEESGEHTLLGTGELYMDCMMFDLRSAFSEIEVRVSDPVTSFCETVVETSALRCFASTPNGANRIAMIAEPLEGGLAEDIENGFIRPEWGKRKVGEFFQSKYNWDLLASRSIWAFGPDSLGPNILVDDTLPAEVDKTALRTVREAVVQGFQWGCREGPLCEEPIRNVKFRLLAPYGHSQPVLASETQHAEIAAEPMQRSAGQIIPTARRTAYSAFLLATPRLMEPVYASEIQCPADCIQVIYDILQRRRGHVVRDFPKAGSPLYTVQAYIPVMDSFGFETDIRLQSQGQAFVLSVFDHWSVVPGDPLDRNIVLRPLEPSPPPALAREFMVKTRRRKGLSENVTVTKFFDEPMLMEIAQQENLDIL